MAGKEHYSQKATHRMTSPTQNVWDKEAAEADCRLVVARIEGSGALQRGWGRRGEMECSRINGNPFVTL